MITDMTIVSSAVTDLKIL